MPSNSEIESSATLSVKPIISSTKMCDNKMAADSNTDDLALTKRQVLKPNISETIDNTIENSSKKPKACEMNDSAFADEAYLTV